MPRPLSIHIIGCGFGESIIVTLPNGSVGVIDCFSPTLKAEDSAERLRANPTLRYLRQTLHADRLAFLALTHPHEDHGRGISHLLIEYKDRIDGIWIFDAFQDLGLERYFSAVLNDRRTLPIEELLEEEPGTFSVELLSIRDLVMEQIDRDNPRLAVPSLFSGHKSFQISGEPVSITFLGPSVALAQEYKASLLDNLRDLVDAEGRVINRAWKHDTVNHNLASPSVLLEYGTTRILLGGDMERDGWREAIKEHMGKGGTFQCHFVKVA